MGNRIVGAIEAGGTKFVLALAQEDGAVLAESRVPTGTALETWPQVTAFFRESAAKFGPISAFGVASFGPIDINPRSPAYGTFSTTPKPGWSGARYHDVLADFGAPIVVDTDVNGAALGEWSAGAGQGCQTLAYTTVGTGVGTGIVHNGLPRSGFSHYESGHIAVARDLPRDPFAGTCPYHGDCLEGLASGPAIMARWGSSLSEPGNDPQRTMLIADYLAQLAVNLILLHMPDRMIFGGGVSKTPGLIAALRERTAARLGGYIAAPQLDPGLERYIVAPSLGDAAGITGAILLARSALAPTS